MMISAPAMGAEVCPINEMTLNWQAPTENVDGSPLTDLAGYNVYWGPSSGNYTGILSIPDPLALTHSFPITEGVYYVVMTALDVDTNESSFSNQIIKTICDIKAFPDIGIMNDVNCTTSNCVIRSL